MEWALVQTYDESLYDLSSQKLKVAEFAYFKIVEVVHCIAE